MCPKSVLLLGLVLFCQVLGKPTESSTESSSSNDILDAATSAAYEIQSSTTSSENALSNEVLPTEALISATLRVPKHPPGTTTTTTTDSIPIFSRTKVELDLNPTLELIPYFRELTCRLFRPIGNLVRRSLVRFAQGVRFFQPLFGNHLLIVIPKNLDV